MKKNLKFIVLALLVVVSAGTSVKAATAGFSGSAGSAWSYVTNPAAYDNTKALGNKYTGVNWQYSNQGSHKMWFRVVNSNGEEKGKYLYQGLGSDAFATSAQQNYYYWLQSKRENSNTPAYITGVWAP